MKFVCPTRIPPRLQLQSKDESYLSIYHAMLATLIWLGVKLVLQDYRDRNVFVDPALFSWSFNKLDVVMIAWVRLMLAAQIPLLIVQILKRNPNSTAIFQRCVFLYGATILFLLTYSSYTCIANHLSPASGSIVMCEAARLCMKVHAYIREKVVLGLPRCWDEQLATARASPTPAPGPNAEAAPRTLRSAGPAPAKGAAAKAAMSLHERIVAFADHIPPAAAKSGVTVEQIRATRPVIRIGSLNDEINCYVYFLFCPTLVYRDEYPRTGGQVDWVRAAVHLMHLLG